jgi:hypothetical protein
MALHRDIYWVGRQWAVTGYGLQAVDQKLKSRFDIEVSRLWEDGLLESMQSEKWLNIDDFAKGLSMARARYPEPPQVVPPLQTNVPALEQGDPTAPPASVVEPLKPPAPRFEMLVESWPAKFIRPWRVGVRRLRT